MYRSVLSGQQRNKDISPIQERAIYYRLSRQVITEYKVALGQSSGWKRSWMKWKIRLTIDLRYSTELYSADLYKV
jgi:hypothetical protein